MSAPRIERGPMVAEVLERDYTRIGNRLIRDPEISYKAKGIFVYMASHKDGFGVSPESIAAAGRDGISAVKSALRELEQRGYLARSQARTTDGTMGQTIYRITDMPSSEPVDGNRPADATCEDEQHSRSGPVDGNPLADDPPAGDHPHKKTIPPVEDQLVEDEISLPPVPAQRTAGAAPAEREIVTPIDRPSTAQQVVRAANLLTGNDDETAFITWATARYRIRSGALWRTVAANGDLVDWVAAWRAEDSQTAAYGLTGTDATVMGWMALADQLSQDGGAAVKPSVTDQRVQHALDLGRRMQAEADARNGGYRPQNPNDAWAYIEQQATAGARPGGWERVPHCGHPDCDEVTRMREVEDVQGVRSTTYCARCHPALNF